MMIAVEIGGDSSMLGEVWFAEADTPLGPWAYARKVATHQKYSFYNPKQHPIFAKRGGRTIFFEGTYTVSFSGNDNPTPRYDYNQIMYKLDLDDPRLNLPVPIYEDVLGYLHPKMPGLPIAFFALERPGAGTVPDATSIRLCSMPCRPTGKDPTTSPLEQTGNGGMHGLKASSKSADRAWGVSEPVGRVWRNPLKVVLPPG